MNFLLSNMASEVRLRIENIRHPVNAGMFIEVKRHGKRWIDLASLSGGEKVLTVEAMILSMHLQTDSLIHAIDECTQRLDLKFKAMAFEMVQIAVQNLAEKTTGTYTPQFILLAPDTIGIVFDEDEDKYFHRIVLAPATAKKPKKQNIIDIYYQIAMNMAFIRARMHLECIRALKENYF